MITEDYVSFETAKLLKEKGFDVWGDDSGIEIYKEYSPSGLLKSCATSKPHPKGYPAPILQMVMKWLRDVHNIFIGISVCERYENLMDADTKIMFFFELFSLKEKQTIDVPYQYYVRTYEEACEAAIKYCLENLI